MKNKKLYFLTCAISIIGILPSFFFCNSITSVLSGIGCSGLAAAIMAIFLEREESKRERQKIKKARQVYFDELNKQLVMMIERLLWFNERLEEDGFNWDLNPSEYSSYKYMVFSSCIAQQKTVSFLEAMERLSNIGKKYNLENIKDLSEQQRMKVHRMFLIIAASSRYLIREINTVVANKLVLETEEYLSIKEIESVAFDVSRAVGLMEKQDKNYEVAVSSLISAAKKIREVGDYNNDIRIGLHGSFEITDL